MRGCSVGTCGGSALTTEPPPLCPPRRALDQRQGSASARRLLGKIHALLQAAATSELQSNRGAFAKLIRSRHSSPTSKLAKLTHLPSKSRNSVRSSHQHRVRRPNAHPLLCISLQFANPTLFCMPRSHATTSPDDSARTSGVPTGSRATRHHARWNQDATPPRKWRLHSLSDDPSPPTSHLISDCLERVRAGSGDLTVFLFESGISLSCACARLCSDVDPWRQKAE